MNLSISNIAWDKGNDEKVFFLMKKYNFSGLEIAPTRIIPNNPYESLSLAENWAKKLQNEWSFCIPSMQSIWFGKTERIFSSAQERNILLEYTKKAINFAKTINCKNLVFGCPKNRNLSDGENSDIALEFFYEIGNYAFLNDTIFSVEANPSIYNTNYINTTKHAFDLVKKINSKGVMVNLDLGTMIKNNENFSVLEGNVKYISHVHFSEPFLNPLEKRKIHKDVLCILQNEDYAGFVSIEMKNQELTIIEKNMEYLKEISK